jgi:hypothetical protein
MSDFAFLNRDPIDRIAQRRQHMEDIRRDAFKRKLKLIGDDCEEATEHCRVLIRAGSDVSEEIGRTSNHSPRPVAGGADPQA